MKTPLPYTPQEVKDKLLADFRATAVYWAELPNKTPLERTEGAIFSILSTLDGSSGLPSFDLVVRENPDNESYRIAHGQRWFKDGTLIDTSLHEPFYVSERRGGM